MPRRRKKRMSKPLKVFLLVLAIIAALIVLVYGALLIFPDLK